MRSFVILEKMGLSPFLFPQISPPFRDGSEMDPSPSTQGFANPSLAGTPRHPTVRLPASWQMNCPCHSSLEPWGNWAWRSPWNSPSSFCSPAGRGCPMLTLLTTMKPLESMLMPLCFRKPVAGTAPAGEGKSCWYSSRVGSQPWGQAGPPTARTTRLPHGKGSSCSGNPPSSHRLALLTPGVPPAAPATSSLLESAHLLFLTLEDNFQSTSLLQIFEKKIYLKGSPQASQGRTPLPPLQHVLFLEPSFSVFDLFFLSSFCKSE